MAIRPLLARSFAFLLAIAPCAAFAQSAEELDDALPRDTFEREPIPFQAAFLAGRAFREYRRRGGLKTKPLPDFFIGAHAR
jgi:predicted nucleic acid-binding protein